MSEEKIQILKGRFPLIIGLAIMPVLSACSSTFMPAGPNLVGAGNFQDESLDEGDVLFQKKKLNNQNLPAPDVTGALRCSVASQTKIISGYKVRVYDSMDCLLKK